MSRVIVNKIWFQEVAPRSFYNEEDLERAIIQNLQIIFPQFRAFLFKKNLLNPLTLAYNKPDLAMVKTDYSEWYIIEVELGKHSLDHVSEQIETFYNCSYDEEHAGYIQSQCPELDSEQIAKMVAAYPPKLMVIVNESKPDWLPSLKIFDCKVCVFQIYHDYEGKPLYRVNGEHPYIYTNFCHCKYQKVGAPFVVEVLDKHFLDGYYVKDGEKLNIEFKGIATTWQRENDGGRTFLHCNDPFPPLDPLTDRYRLNYIDSLKIFSFTKD